MKESKELPIIEFEGKKVNPKSGYYRCPFNCSRPDYPSKKWKTEKGFREHMESCHKRPSVVKQKEENNDAAKERVLANLSYKIGDKIIFINEVVTHPTHEQRGSRMVKVRHEEKIRYTAEETEITSIDYINCVPASFTDEQIQTNNIVFNKRIRYWWIFNGTFSEAAMQAARKQLAHEEHLAFSSLVR